MNITESFLLRGNVGNEIQAMLLLFFLLGALLFYSLPNRNKVHRILFFTFLFWAFLKLKLFFITDKQILAPQYLFLDMLSIPISSFYAIELLYPGKVNFRYVAKQLLPFFAFILLYIVSLFFGEDVKYINIREIFEKPFTFGAAIRIGYALFSIVYAAAISVKILKKSKEIQSRIPHHYSYTENIDVSWLSNVVYALLFSLLAYLFLIASQIEKTIADLIYYAISLLVWIYVSKKVMKHEVYDELEFCENEISMKATSKEVNSVKPYHFVKEKLAKAIDEKKLYLNPKLSITDLAKECQTNRTYISDYLNNELKINFFDFINRERIEKASIPLLLDKNSRMGIEEIAYSSGFGSVSTFRRAFEKLKGTSPLNFKKTI